MSSIEPSLTRRGLLASAAASALGTRAALASSSATDTVSSSPEEAGAPGGYAVPIGGALRYDNDPVWRELVRLAGGPGARYAVFATASANPDRSASQIVAALQRQGAVAEHIPVAPRLKGTDPAAAVQDPRLLAKVRLSQGVFFAGGAQERIVDTLLPGGASTPMLDAVRSVQERGGVVAGTSAGAAIMSRVMFRDAQDVLGVMKGRLRDGREVDRGLGFVPPELFVDQHFLKRGRFGRMLPLMLAKGYAMGLGVDENTAAVLHGGQVSVIGGKGALLVDLTDARSEPSLGAFNLRGARLTYLDHGDRFDLAARQVLPSPQKLADQRIDPNAPDFKPYNDNHPFYLDMLGDSTLVNAMGNLIDNARREVRDLAFSARPAASDPQPELGFEFRLYKGDDSLGWYSGAFGGEDYTVSNLYLDVQPVRIARPFYTPWTPQTRS